VADQSREHQVIVTDLWWLDQVAAKLSDSRTFLYAARGDQQRDVVAALEGARVPDVLAVASATESSARPAEWFAGSCYRAERSASVPERQLSAVTLVRRCP